MKESTVFFHGWRDSMLIDQRNTDMNQIQSGDTKALSIPEDEFFDMACYRIHRATDRATEIEYRDCKIDYTACPNKKCIKKLV